MSSRNPALNEEVFARQAGTSDEVDDDPRRRSGVAWLC